MNSIHFVRKSLVMSVRVVLAILFGVSITRVSANTETLSTLIRAACNEFTIIDFRLNNLLDTAITVSEVKKLPGKLWYIFDGQIQPDGFDIGSLDSAKIDYIYHDILGYRTIGIFSKAYTAKFPKDELPMVAVFSFVPRTTQILVCRPMLIESEFGSGPLFVPKSISWPGLQQDLVTPILKTESCLDSPDTLEVSYPGGKRAWRDYLENNLRVSTPTDNNAPIGNYKVYVNFDIGVDGKLSNIVATKEGEGPDYGTMAEGVRVVRNSRNSWLPVLKNGQPIVYHQKQTIVFMQFSSQ